MFCGKGVVFLCRRKMSVHMHMKEFLVWEFDGVFLFVIVSEEMGHAIQCVKLCFNVVS